MRDMNAHAGEFIKTDESGKRSVDARAFRAEYERLTGYYKSELNSGNPDAVNQFEPLIVSGSKDTTTQDLYTETSLKVKNRFNGETIQQHNDAITAEQNEWKKANDQRLAAMSVSDREAEIQTNLEQISTLYIQKHSAFGTEVEKIEKEIACAIREGKPVVIDEINAIPVPVFVSLNHILTRRAGDTVNLLGSDEQMEVVDGFSIIMTGNLSRPGANYIGVNDLNPAFLSRLKIMHYDYLPQSTEGNIDQQSDPEKMNCFMFC
jgi:MoxR-like ATPase